MPLLTRTRRGLTIPGWPLSSRVADNYKQWFTLLLSRAWRRLALLGGRTENSLTGGVPHRSVGPPFLIRTRRLPGSTRVCYAVRALLGVARAGRCCSSVSRQLRAIVAALGLWPGRPMTPLDMVLVRESLPGLPGNSDAFLAEAKRLHNSARMGSWSSHRRGERRTPSRTPRSCR